MNLYKILSRIGPKKSKSWNSKIGWKIDINLRSGSIDKVKTGFETSAVVENIWKYEHHHKKLQYFQPEVFLVIELLQQNWCYWKLSFFVSKLVTQQFV